MLIKKTPLMTVEADTVNVPVALDPGSGGINFDAGWKVSGNGSATFTGSAGAGTLLAVQQNSVDAQVFIGHGSIVVDNGATKKSIHGALKYSDLVGIGFTESTAMDAQSNTWLLLALAAPTSSKVTISGQIDGFEFIVPAAVNA